MPPPSSLGARSRSPAARPWPSRTTAEWLASAEWNNQVHLWDVATGEPLAADHPMMGVLFNAAFAPDDRWLAVVGAGIKLWDITTRQGKPTLTRRRELTGHYSEVLFMDVSPDGKRLVTTGQDRSLKVWDAATGRQLASWFRPSGIHGAAFSPDNKTLAAVGPSGARGTKPAGLLTLWALDDLLAPDRVKARAQAAVAELFRLARAGKQDEAFRQLAALGPAPETTIPLLLQELKSRDRRTHVLALAALSLEGEAAKPFLPEIRALLGAEAEYDPARQALQRIEGRQP
jgi:hypothetical protein